MDYIVAIDGPSGSGKSTIAREVASRLGGEVLDTGAMYRAVAWFALEHGVEPTDAERVAELLASFEVHVDGGAGQPAQVKIGNADITEAIRSPEVTAASSIVAAYPAVRKRLRQLQRDWAEARGGGVVEGRDIGTDVFPEARHKFYLTASAEERATRRADETGTTKTQVLPTLQSRDAADKSRQHSPLRKADDAIELDTTGFTVEQTVERVLSMIASQAASGGVASKDFSAYDFPAAKNYGTKRSLGNRIFYSTARRLCLLISGPYLRQRIKNRQHLPAEGPVIVAPGGHRSNLDTLLVGMAVRRSAFYMAKDSLFKSRFWSSFIRAFGGFPVARDKLDRRALETAVEALERGEALIVFPEGSRQEGPKLQPLFVGVAWLSAKTGAPVVPLGIGGSQKVMPIGKIMPRPHRIRMILGEPMPPPLTGGSAAGSSATGKSAAGSSARASREARDEFTKDLSEKLQVLFDEAQEWAGTPNADIAQHSSAAQHPPTS